MAYRNRRLSRRQETLSLPMQQRMRQSTNNLHEAKHKQRTWSKAQTTYMKHKQLTWSTNNLHEAKHKHDMQQPTLFFQCTISSPLSSFLARREPEWPRGCRGFRSRSEFKVKRSKSWWRRRRRWCWRQRRLPHASNSRTYTYLYILCKCAISYLLITTCVKWNSNC